MGRIFLVVISFFTLAAQAKTSREFISSMNSLKCTGKNGVTLELLPKAENEIANPIIVATLFGASQNFVAVIQPDDPRPGVTAYNIWFNNWHSSYVLKADLRIKSGPQSFEGTVYSYPDRWTDYLTPVTDVECKGDFEVVDVG